jgi:hypothetical protein
MPIFSESTYGMLEAAISSHHFTFFVSLEIPVIPLRTLGIEKNKIGRAHV